MAEFHKMGATLTGTVREQGNNPRSLVLEKPRDGSYFSMNVALQPFVGKKVRVRIEVLED